MHNTNGDVVDITNGSTYSNNCYIYNAFGSNEYFDNTDSVGMYNQWGYCDQLKDYETGNYYMGMLLQGITIGVGGSVGVDIDW